MVAESVPKPGQRVFVADEGNEVDDGGESGPQSTKFAGYEEKRNGTGRTVRDVKGHRASTGKRKKTQLQPEVQGNPNKE
uniref:Uncharacterized protein n=1 Tax=Caenorhabditis japonica TaxID=281687 RepID=A0A8R1IQ24_CAEJA